MVSKVKLAGRTLDPGKVKASIAVKLPVYLIEDLREAIAKRNARAKTGDTTTLTLELWRILDPKMVKACEEHPDWKIRNLYWARRRNGNRFGTSEKFGPPDPGRVTRPVPERQP